MPLQWQTLPSGQVEIQGEGITYPTPAYEARLRKVVDRWGPLARRHADRAQVPWAWIVAFIAEESGGDPSVVSPKGATGLMQLMPVWWHGHTQAEIKDPETNVAIGADLLAILRSSKGTGGELPKIASAYNCGAGPGNAPHLWPTSRWGMCGATGYIDGIVRDSNFAFATWPDGARGGDVTSTAAFLLKLWGLLRLAGIRLPW